MRTVVSEEPSKLEGAVNSRISIRLEKLSSASLQKAMYKGAQIATLNGLAYIYMEFVELRKIEIGPVVRLRLRSRIAER